jgi:hypothetical protein
MRVISMPEIQAATAPGSIAPLPFTAGRVELEHRHFDRHGPGADGVRRGVDSPEGWTYCLELFAKVAA